MSSSSLYDSLQIASNFMEQAERLIKANEFEAAFTALEKAKSYAFNNKTLLEDIETRFEALNNAHRNYIRRLEEDAANLFNQEHFDSQKAREALLVLKQQNGQSELAQTLWEELFAREAAQRERRLVEEFQQNLEAIWQCAYKLETDGAGAEAITQYQHALVEATKKSGDSPDVIPLQRLKLTATEKLKQAQEKWEGIPRLILERNGVELVARYEAYKDRGDEEVEFFDENGNFVERLPIDVCLEQAKEMAGRFAEQSIRDYLNQARELLTESPGAAYQKIQEAFALTLPGDSARELLQKELEEKIEPAMQAREKAQTQLQAALSLESPLDAWQVLDNIEQTDRFTPGLQNARESLSSTLEQNVVRLVDSGHQLQQLEDFDTAQTRFREAIEICRVIADQRDSLQELYRKAREGLTICVQSVEKVELFQEYLTEIQELSQANPRQANKKLSKLNTGELPAQAVAQVERLKVQIDFKLGVEKLYQTFEEKLLAVADPVELIPVEEGVRQASQDYPDDERFPLLVERVIARRSFLKGSQLCKDPEQYAEALELLRDVVERQGDDANAAQQLIDEISTTEQQEADLAMAIEDASRAIEKEDYRAAYLLLEPHRYVASKQTAKVRELLGVAASCWREELEQQLEALVAAGNFSLPKVEYLLHELERCQSPRLNEWRVKALAPAYAITARDLQELDRWEQAEELWEEAFRLAPTDPEILDGRRKAHKHRAIVRAQTAVDPVEKEQLLDDLNRTYGNDPAIKRFLAAFYYNQRRYTEARLAISQMRLLLEHGGNAVSETDLESIQHMESRIVEAEKIENRQAAIREQISVDAPLDKFRDARKAFESLLEAVPHQNERLEHWWAGLADETIKKINERVTELADKAGTVWVRAVLLCKILILQNNLQTQEQAMRMLKLAYDQLPPDVELVVDNPQGAGFGPVEEALSTHIAKAKEVYERVVDMNQVEHILVDLGINMVQFESDLNETLYKLELTLEKLHFTQEKQREIKNLLSTAITTGNWNLVDDSLIELKLKGWNEHRTVAALAAVVDSAKNKRDDLEATVKKFKEAVAQEDFNSAQEYLEHIHVIDPADEIQIQANLVVVDPYLGQSIEGYNDLSIHIAKKLASSEKLKQWQADFGTPVNWPIARSRISKLANRGDFKPAIDMTKAVMGQNNEHPTIQKDGAWSLVQLYRYLEGFPLATEEQINSRAAKIAFDEAQQRLQLVTKQLKECEAVLAQLQQSEMEFSLIIKALKPLVERLNASKFLSSIFSSSELQETKRQVSDLVRQGRQICPDHPALADFEEKAISKK